VAFRLIPREERFFDDFVALAEQIRRGAGLLEDMLRPERPIWDKADEIKEVEHKCDFLTHEIIQRLHRTFVTPLDREDIIQLYSSIDDMTDFIHSAADMMATYKVESVTPIAQQLSDTIVGCAEEVAKAVTFLRSRKNLGQIQPSVVQIHSLENKADELQRAGLAELFAHPEDVINIIKWRDIYQELEQATDEAEDVADVLRGLAIKHA
jgi:uncharacterized protein